MRGLARWLALGVLLVSLSAYAGNDPRRIWQTIETAHFRVYFYQGEYAIAMKAAKAAEEAHEKVTALLGHTPEDPCYIVITDDNDGANGSARVVPYNLIRIFVTAPAEDSVLSDYDDWLRGLILHEYTHIVHLDTISGLPKFTNRITGKIWSPNQMEPRWIIEGLATFAESALTTAGRANSAAQDMYLRMAVLEDRMLTLDQMTSLPEPWPRGNTFYLFGSGFMEYLAGRFGAETIAEFSHAYGETVIPYGLNKVAAEVFGAGFDVLYEDWLSSMRDKYRAQQAEIEAQGRVEGVRLTMTGEEHNSPRFSPDGTRLSYYESNGRQQAGLFQGDLSTGSAARAEIKISRGGEVAPSYQSERVARLASRAGTDYAPDGRSLILHQQMQYQLYYFYKDLYRYDLDTGEMARLTRGERASDPTISPDGRYVAYAQNRAGSTNLALLDLTAPEEPARVILEHRDFTQVFTPSFSPDGKTIAVSLWTRGGFRDIVLVDVETGTKTQLTKDRAIDADPAFSYDGKLLYFSSDRTGVPNLYAYEFETQALHQVTNVLGGAYEPSPSPDGQLLVYVGYHAKGYDLYALPVDRTSWRPAPPPRDRSAPDYADEPIITEPETKLKVGRYRPWETLRPYTWSPLLGQDAYGSNAGLVVQGADAVGLHAFSLAAQFSTVNGNPTVGASYSYNGTWPTLTASAARFTSVRQARPSGVPLLYAEESISASAGASIFYARPFWAASLALRYEGQLVRPDDPALVDGFALNPSDPLTRLPDDGLVSGLSATVSLSSQRRFTFSVTPEEGFSASLTARTRSPLLGSDFQSKELLWNLDKYLPLRFLGRHHALAFSLSGGVASFEDARLARGFVVGGPPQQDVFGALVLLSPSFVGGGFLRGFEPGFSFGTQFHILNSEYRFPITRIERGLGTLPVYAKRLHGRLFVDYGAAFFGDLDPAQLRPASLGGQMRTGYGAELLLDGVIGYFVGTTLRLGVARGVGEGAVTDSYLLVGAPF